MNILLPTIGARGDVQPCIALALGLANAGKWAKSPHWMVGFKRVMDFSFAMLEWSHADQLALCRGADLGASIHAESDGVTEVVWLIERGRR
jgi:hypothetical protein